MSYLPGVRFDQSCVGRGLQTRNDLSHVTEMSAGVWLDDKYTTKSKYRGNISYENDTPVAIPFHVEWKW